MDYTGVLTEKNSSYLQDCAFLTQKQFPRKKKLCHKGSNCMAIHFVFMRQET